MDGSPRFWQSCRLPLQEVALTPADVRIGPRLSDIGDLFDRAGPAAPGLPIVSQILVDECDCHAALTDGGRNSLHWAQPHVAAGENTGRTCFKKVGIAAMRPALGLLHIVTRQNVSACIARHIRGQPFRLRIGTDEDEQAAAIMPTDLIACLVANVDRRKVSVAVDCMNFRSHLDR